MNAAIKKIATSVSCILLVYTLQAQAIKKKTTYAGIEVGSKGVKMSIIEIDNSNQQYGFTIFKDTTVNTDFISFSTPTYQATLNAVVGLYNLLITRYALPSNKIFTVISSGVKMQAYKEKKTDWVQLLSDSIKIKTNEPKRTVDIVDVMQEARLSHLGIVAEKERYKTFLIDIGSGNTKGGYFPNGNTGYFYLFQLNWGTKSTTNAAQKRAGDDKTLTTYKKELTRVAAEAENTDIVYAVNASGAYPASDNIAFSGGIAWAVATLLHPEQLKEPVVTVTYNDVKKLYDQLADQYSSLQENNITQPLALTDADAIAINKEVKRVHGVFDQPSLLGGTALLLKIMRQFESVYERKHFYIVKNGQVGWISAYVVQTVQQ
ncbi:MAG: hypothetical protein SFU21_11610 [Flavihumibacter sp.]|nr:hypothetical protein [Flavihumibacter sp.]